MHGPEHSWHPQPQHEDPHAPTDRPLHRRSRGLPRHRRRTGRRRHRAWRAVVARPDGRSRGDRPAHRIRPSRSTPSTSRRRSHRRRWSSIATSRPPAASTKPKARATDGLEPDRSDRRAGSAGRVGGSPAGSTTAARDHTPAPAGPDVARRPAARPDARPMRAILGLTGMAAAAAMATLIIRPPAGDTARDQS